MRGVRVAAAIVRGCSCHYAALRGPPRPRPHLASPPPTHRRPSQLPAGLPRGEGRTSESASGRHSGEGEGGGRAMGGAKGRRVSEDRDFKEKGLVELMGSELATSVRGGERTQPRWRDEAARHARTSEGGRRVEYGMVMYVSAATQPVSVLGPTRVRCGRFGWRGRGPCWRSRCGPHHRPAPTKEPLHCVMIQLLGSVSRGSTEKLATLVGTHVTPAYYSRFLALESSVDAKVRRLGS